jgi:hypothetical protein
MPYKEPPPESREELLWTVHDDCMAWLTDAQERTVPDSRKLDRLMLGLASLAKALAGGYREDGVRS